jgi:hypothetical protein
VSNQQAIVDALVSDLDRIDNELDADVVRLQSGAKAFWTGDPNSAGRATNQFGSTGVGFGSWQPSSGNAIVEGCWNGFGGSHDTHDCIIAKPNGTGSLGRDSFQVNGTRWDVTAADPAHPGAPSARVGNASLHPTASLTKQGLFAQGSNWFISHSIFWPADFPSMTLWADVNNLWHLFMELYGAPYGGSPPHGVTAWHKPSSFGMDAADWMGVGDYIQFVGNEANGGYTYWSDLIQRGFWLDLVWQIQFNTVTGATANNDGWVKCWSSWNQNSTFTLGSPRLMTNTNPMFGSQVRVGQMNYHPIIPSINGNGPLGLWCPDSYIPNQATFDNCGGTITTEAGRIKVDQTLSNVLGR